MILVIIDLSMIFKDTFGEKINDEVRKLNENRNDDNSYCATFGSQNVSFNEEKFNDADLNAVFGGIKFDLRNAIIDGDIVINASAIFGGIEIYVPVNVKVKIKSIPIFGSVNN